MDWTLLYRDLLINELNTINSQWENAAKKGGEALKAIAARKEQLTNDQNALLAELLESNPTYAAVQHAKPIAADKLPLRNNEVLLEFALGDDASYLKFASDAKNGRKKTRSPPTKLEPESENLVGLHDQLQDGMAVPRRCHGVHAA